MWTPDGKRVTYAAARAGKPENLFWKFADGSGAEERLATSEYAQRSISWSPDGQVLAFDESAPATGGDIWTLPLKGERKPRLFFRTPFAERNAVFSPDGHWLSYVSTESGRDEIYVQPFPGPGGKWQISSEGGTEPVWARNGRELFFRNGDKMMAVDIAAGPTFSAGKPRLVFQGQYHTGDRPDYDVTPDGQRFLMIKDGGEESAGQINVVLNWFEELKRKVPSGKR